VGGRCSMGGIGVGSFERLSGECVDLLRKEISIQINIFRVAWSCNNDCPISERRWVSQWVGNITNPTNYRSFTLVSHADHV
jgi:hypothetical protein